MSKNFYSSFRGLSRTADMALNPGEVDYGNRQGLRWHRFSPGQFQGENSLPEEASGTISNMMNRFKEEFSQFRMNPQTEQVITKFRGMIFAIYAHDTALSGQGADEIPPELQETAEFVRQNHLRMIPNGTEKSIGTDFWITHNAHAYADLFPNDVQKVQKSSPESIVPLKSEGQRSKAEQADIPHGDLVVAPRGRGYGPFIDWDGNLEPILRGQAATNTEKFFVDNLRMGASLVSMPQGPRGPIVSARRINLRAGDRDNVRLRDEQARRLEIYNDAIHNETAYRLFNDEEGAIYAKNVSTEEEFYLTEQQVQSIIRPEQLNRPFFVRPAKGQPISSIREGQWRVTDELKNHLATTDAPVGFQALTALREHLDNSYREQHGVAMHAPYEGFKIIMIGPSFSNPKNLGEGQTQSLPGFATHLTATDPEVQPEGPIDVNRGINWVVISNEIRPNQQDRMNPWTRVQGKSERSASFATPQEAVQYVMSQYVDADVPGNQSVLSATAESLVEADRALNAALKMPAGGLPAAPPPQQISAPTVENPAATPIPEVMQPQPIDSTSRMASSSLRATLRRLKR